VAAAIESATAVRASARRIPGANVLAVRPGLTCYGHVLVEMLPAAWIVEDGPRRPGVLIGASGGALARISREVLHRLGYTDEQITESKVPVVVDTLLVVEGFAETARYISPLIVEYAEQLASVAAGIPGLGPLLYLPRKPEYGRGIVNDREVSEALTAKGFVTLYPEDLPLAAQVAAFRDAKVIVGVMGSALTNLLFSRSGARALALAPEFMVDTFFWRVAGCVGVDYAELRCTTADSEKWLRTDRLLDRDIHVEVDVLLDWISEAES
jgi:capsular polysaccharide biosynthesis protein